MSSEPQLGAIVEIPAGRGVVRFCGATSFAAGKWVGIELNEANGKNNGTINGIAYFTCQPNHGVFVRPSQVKVIGSERDLPSNNRPPATATPAAGHTRTPSTGLSRNPSLRIASNETRSMSPPEPPNNRPPPVTVRPASGHTRTGSAGLGRTTSLRSTASNTSRSTSPIKPGSSTSSRASPAPPASSQAYRTTSPTKGRPSLGLAPPSTVRKPFARTSSHTSSGGDGSTLLSPTSRRIDSPSKEPFGLSRTTLPRTLSPLSPSLPSPSPPLRPPSSFTSGQPSTSRQSFSRPSSSLANQIIPEKVVDDTELQELRAKVRVLEAKRADDARHVRELETRLSEAESFVALRPKLQAKLNSQQTELIATRRELADSKQLAELSEARVVDAQEQLEMAMLDKEVAEERAEIAESELDDLRERLAIAEVELEVIKEGGEEVGEGGESNAKSSLAYIQLEKQNERLKEALIRLRDMTSENEQEQRRRIAEMEKDMTGIDDLQSNYESTLIKLSNAEVQIEDLKVQLDDALGAEEMLVQLTERNLMLGEKIEEMRITIEDLEALKELNDELEENHVETEKTMQEDLDIKDVHIRDQQRKIESLEEACQDLDGTINQFRELVMNLQNDLDTLRMQTQTARNESATAASQTAAMMSLNLKLQSSASKNQAKLIELEIKKLEARETRELLGIVQPYLPQLYVESDSDATSCYLFFQRIAYKADLISSVVAQAHGLPDALNGPVSDVLVGVCEMRGRIAGLSTLCKRFAAVLRRCDVESFLNIGRIYQEIAPMEKRIDMHVDLLRRDQFREMECVSDVIKMQAQFDHLAETYFNGFEYDLGERELGYALSFEHDLDVFAASIGLTKTSVAAIVKDEDVTSDMGGLDPGIELFEPLQKLLDQCKGAKALSRKLTKRLEDLTHDSGALKSHLLPRLKALNNLVPELVNFGISLAQQTMPHLSDVRGDKTPFQLATVLSYVKQTAETTVAKNLKPGMSPWGAVGESILELVQEGSDLLPLALETESVTKLTGTAPWVTRIAEIKASTAINIEAERKVAQLNDEMQGLVRSLKTKDQSIQESVVKIELMERRMETVKKQADTIDDLAGELSKARKQERAYEEAMEQLQADLDALEQDNAKLKAMTAGPERQGSVQPLETENVPIEGSLETSHLLEQIDALRGTVRYLRTENSYLKGQDLLKEIHKLPPLPEPVVREPTPPLDPSGLSDSDDSDSEPSTPPTLRSLATETKLLYRDVMKFSSSPRVVDLSALNARRAEAKATGGKVWMPKMKTPGHQVLQRKMEAERLSRRVQGLLDRASAL